MIQIDSITLNKYFELEDKTEYNFVINYSHQFNEPIDEFGIGDFKNLSFGIIKDLQDDYSEGMTFEKMIDHITNTFNIKDIGKHNLDKVCRLIAYIRTSIREIMLVEAQSLAYESTSIDHDAGMGDFEVLGVYMQFHELTGGDITKYDSVRQTPYHLCFTELYARKLIYDYQQRIDRLRRSTK